MKALPLTPSSAIAAALTAVVLVLDINRLTDLTAQAGLRDWNGRVHGWVIGIGFDLTASIGLIAFFVSFTFRNRIGTYLMKHAALFALICTLAQLVRQLYSLGQTLGSEHYSHAALGYFAIYMTWNVAIALFFLAFWQRLRRPTADAVTNRLPPGIRQSG